MNAPMEPLAGLVRDGGAAGAAGLGMSGGGGRGAVGRITRGPAGASMIGVDPSSAFHFASHCETDSAAVQPLGDVQQIVPLSQMAGSHTG